MKSLAIAMALCTLISSAGAADQTCRAKAINRSLPVKLSLTSSSSAKLMPWWHARIRLPASLTTTPSWTRVWRMRLEWGLGGANHIIAVRTLIALAVLVVRFAGRDFADGDSRCAYRLKQLRQATISIA